MSDHILYSNKGVEGLDDISGQNQTLEEIRQNITDAMTSLNGVYTGQSAQALSDAHQKIQNLLEDAQNQLIQLQQGAVEQHHTMFQVDANGANAF
jgi:uncharacterized protein YukE